MSDKSILEQSRTTSTALQQKTLLDHNYNNIFSLEG